MKTLVNLLLCLFVSHSLAQQLANCGVPQSRSAPTQRIIGGSAANRGQFPWQASLQVRRNGDLWYHSCGATILNANWIITAAHCVFGFAANDLRVVVGADTLDGLTDVQANLAVSNITLHESYSASGLTNDLALIRLATPVNIDGSSGFINGVCLPDEGQKFTQYVTLSGWGTTSYDSLAVTNKLQFVGDVPIVSLPKCRSIYGNNAVREGMLCAGSEEGGRGSCRGDSGGPLIQDDGTGKAQLVGISSWSVGCALPGVPSVFVEISYYRDWLDANAV